jgi:hypothetical protein
MMISIQIVYFRQQEAEPRAPLAVWLQTSTLVLQAVCHVPVIPQADDTSPRKETGGQVETSSTVSIYTQAGAWGRAAHEACLRLDPSALSPRIRTLNTF